jgi:hypothetical protein
MEVVFPDAIKCEESGKRIDQGVVDKMWYAMLIADLQCAGLTQFIAR